MSLNYNLTNIEGGESVTTIWTKPQPSDGEVDPERLNDKGEWQIMAPKTHTLIWATIGCKMGEISEENAKEFYARVNFLERVHGAFNYKMVDGKKEDVYVTPEDVQAHIGLTCNVLTESRAKFMAGFKMDLDRATWHYNSETKKETADV